MLLESTLALVIGSIGAWLLIQTRYQWIIHDFRLIQIMMKVKRMTKSCSEQTPAHTIVDSFIEKATANPDKPLLTFEGSSWTYKDMNKKSNRIARVLKAHDVQENDTIAVMISNHPSIIYVWFGAAKAGAAPALINTSVTSNSLVHSISITECKILIILDSEDIMRAIKDIEKEIAQMNIKVFVVGKRTEVAMSSFLALDDLSDEESCEKTPLDWRSTMTLDSPLVYMFTSGTTGLPKAAIMSHDKALRSQLILESLGITQEDKVYIPLPLYHGTGGCFALMGAIGIGCTVIIRRKFSASQFWNDCRLHCATVVFYVGETMRYVCNQPKRDNDKDHCVRMAVGNGLSASVWDTFVNRFGKDIAIMEFYTATESNVGFFNVLNMKNCLGIASPFTMALGIYAFVQYDYETEQPVRDANGRCVKTGLGEPGLLLGRISQSAKFQGYRGNRPETEKKILKDVFKTGDRYFNTNDILLRNHDYRVTFVDRVGDTFRWKGENVSTREVADEMSKVPSVADATVYGTKVPGMEGRAGMIVIELIEGCDSLDCDGLYKHACSNLPAYARPVFVRVQKKIFLTETYKYSKVKLGQDGFDPTKCGDDSLYVIDVKNKTYSPFTLKMYASIENGEISL